MAASYAVTVCSLVVLLLMGVSSSHGQATTCMDKVQECSLLMINRSEQLTKLITSQPPNIDAVVVTCSSVISNLSTCVNEGKTVCSGNAENITSLDNLHHAVDVFCAPASVCQLRATVCQLPLAVAAMPGNSSQTGSAALDLNNVCKVYPQVKTCLGALSDECKAVPTVQTMTSHVMQFSTHCDSDVCLQAIGCFASMASIVQCSFSLNVLKCVSNLKGTCTFDESLISLDDLQPLASNMCKVISPEYETCHAVTRCVETSPELELSDLTSAAMNGGKNSSFLTMLVSRVANPVYMCKHLKVMAGCYISESDKCKFPDDFIKAMKIEQQHLIQRCPGKGTDSGDSKDQGTGANDTKDKGTGANDTKDKGTSDSHSGHDGGSGADRPGAHLISWVWTVMMTAVLTTLSALL